MTAGNRRFVRVAILIALYMLLALSWWAILLQKKNKEIRDLKLTLTELTTVEGSTQNSAVVEYDRQRRMVYMEGSVFMVLLLLGIWYIIRAFQQEISVANQQRNFLLAITHELKSPISVIQLSLQTLHRHDLVGDKKQQVLTAAQVETQRLLGLVNKLLFAARLEASFTGKEEQSVDIPTLVSAVIDTVRLEFPLREILLNAGSPWSIPGNAFELKTMVHNMVENALKYSDSTTSVIINSNPGHIQVADCGRGIPMAERTLVTDMFYRVGDERIRESKGTGIGLYIVAEVAKLHQGRLTITDNDRCTNDQLGTVITITWNDDQYH